MSDVYCIVEGYTEQTFMRDTLAPYLAEKACFLHARLIGTPGHKGGVVTFARFANDARILLKQSSYTMLSSMFDYFRLDASWPGMKDIQLAHASGRELSPQEIETILSQATKNALHALYPNLDVQRRCIPYFSMHEFEALLFSDVRILGDMLPLDGNKLCSIMAEYGGNPEKINTNRAPSIILIDMYNAYKKTIHGCTIADSIGIPRIREQCSCFETWIASLLE